MNTFSAKNLAWYLTIMVLSIAYMVFFDIIINLYDLKMIIIALMIQLFVCYVHSFFMNAMDILTERRISLLIGVCLWIFGTLIITFMSERDFNFGLFHPITHVMIITIVQISMIWIILGYTMILEHEKPDYALVVDFFPVMYLFSSVLMLFFYCQLKPLFITCFAFIGHIIVVIVFVMAFIYHCIEMISECCNNKKNVLHDEEENIDHIGIHFPN